MRFLIQIPQLVYGGAEKVLVHFANTLMEQGHEVEILESYEKGFLKSEFNQGIHFYAICSNEYKQKYYASIKDIKQAQNVLKKLLKCGKMIFSKIVGYRRFAEYLAAKHYADKYFDVAINYLEIESPKFLLNSVNAGKHLQWCHIDVKKTDSMKEIEQYVPMFAKMDAIICVAESAKRSFYDKYPQLKEKTHVIYNFFDKEKIYQSAEEPFSYLSKVPIMLSVGRMTEQKKYIRFLEVLSRLQREGVSFEWHILGMGYQFDDIKDRIKQLHLEKVVFLDGLTDNPYKYMKNCDLFVLPSGWEGFPTVTIEAKILNCPVLATDVSGIKEQIIHGVTGWIVDNNEDAIYEGVKYLLLNEKERNKLRNSEGIEDICDNLEKYHKVIKLVEVDNG